ncbi:MAG: hypothetical protein ACKOKG_08265, partial [Verrucomicrobiota bacterium]
RQVGRSAGRQVGRSAAGVTRHSIGPSRWLGWDHPGGDACLGPPSGQQPSQQADYRNLGKASMVGSAFSSVISQFLRSDFKVVNGFNFLGIFFLAI